MIDLCFGARWRQIVPPESFITHPAYCRAANYANGVARDYANWLVAGLTLERVIRIARPYSARRFCTPRNARIVVLLLFVVICVPHVHALVFSRAQKRTDWVCWEDPDSATGWVLAALVEFVVGYIVVIVVFVLNVILTCLIYRNRVPTPGHHQQQAWQRRASPAGASSDAVNPAALWVVGHGPAGAAAAAAAETLGRRSLQNRRLTRTLIGVATVFLVCETPRMISSVVVKSVDRSPLRRIILNASYVLSGINHASNFFIYIVSSPRFRQLLAESLRRRPRGYGAPAEAPGYRQVPGTGANPRNLAATNAATAAGAAGAGGCARLAVMDDVDLGVSEDRPEDDEQSRVEVGQSNAAATAEVSGSADKDRKGATSDAGAPTASEGTESNSTACGDIYVQINLQLFFAAESQS